jgi:hypothetical protein
MLRLYVNCMILYVNVQNLRCLLTITFTFVCTGLKLNLDLIKFAAAGVFLTLTGVQSVLC